MWHENPYVTLGKFAAASTQRTIHIIVSDTINLIIQYSKNWLYRRNENTVKSLSIALHVVIIKVHLNEKPRESGGKICVSRTRSRDSRSRKPRATGGIALGIVVTESDSHRETCNAIKKTQWGHLWALFSVWKPGRAASGSRGCRSFNAWFHHGRLNLSWA